MKQRADRKQQILQLATEAFSREGYDKVTVKQLADGCGITEPAIYRHYKSKDAIYIAVLESLYDRLDSRELFSRISLQLLNIELCISKVHLAQIYGCRSKFQLIQHVLNDIFATITDHIFDKNFHSWTENLEEHQTRQSDS